MIILLVALYPHNLGIVYRYYLRFEYYFGLWFLVPIPLFNKDIMERIDNKVSSYISKIEVAKENERKAIRMVEEEIEKWNK